MPFKSNFISCISIKVFASTIIGDGAIIGAGSIVTKDVEPFTIIAGNPGRVVRRRFSEEVEKKIIQSKWWFQPLSVIAKELPCFINNPTPDLVDRFNFS